MPFATLNVQLRNDTDRSSAEFMRDAEDLAARVSKDNRVHSVEVRDAPHPEFRDGDAE